MSTSNSFLSYRVILTMIIKRTVRKRSPIQTLELKEREIIEMFSHNYRHYYLTTYLIKRSRFTTLKHGKSTSGKGS